MSLTGDVALEVGGVAAGDRQLRSRHARVVLAMLTLERARPVRREELSELLWGDEPPSSWESVLRTAVARVRAALRDAGLDGRATVRATFGCYQLHLPAGAVVDLEQAEGDVEDALAALAAGRAAEAADRLERVDRVARRPFLPEADGPWVRERRTQNRALRIRALEALTGARMAAGLPAEAVAREVVDLDPFRESAHRLLISALAGGGNRAQALVAYEQCRRLLAEELGVDPSPETEAVYLELLTAEACPPPATAAGPTPGAPEFPARLLVESIGLLVGRTRELDLLRGRMVPTSTGPPGVLLISGEPGMGKTALVAHAARDACAAGALVLYGRCDEEVTLAYRPVVEGLSQITKHLPADVVADHLARYGTGLLRLVPELRSRVPRTAPDPGTDPQTERHLLFRAVAALFTRAATDRPVVLVVDDLHWADKPSLLLLRYLATAAAPGRLVLATTYRGTELVEGGDAAATVRELARQPGAHRLELNGLADDDIVPMVESAAGRRLGPAALGWARAVGRESGGNPFFARELLRHLADRFTDCPVAAGWSTAEPAGPAGLGLPETVRDVVGRRVDRLGERGAAVLAQAAVLGSDFDLATLARVVGTDEDAVLDDLDHAIAAGLLVEVPGDGERFAFGHALVQRTLYERVGGTRRRRSHRRVARALEASATPWPPGRAGDLARHWLLGHDRADRVERALAADRARRAGEQALADLAPDQALVWFRAALDCLDGPDGPADPTDSNGSTRCGPRVDILVGLGEAQRGVGDQGYRETLLGAARLAESAGDTARLVRAVVANNRGAVSSSGRLDADRIALLEAAMAAIGDHAHPRRPLLGATLAIELPGPGHAERRERLADEAVRGARELGDPEVLGRVLALRFEATWAPATHHRRLADSAELLDLATASADRRLRFLAARLRSLACWESGRVAESDEHLAAECRIADEIGEPYLRWVATLSRGGRLQASSRHAEAEDLAGEALRLGSDAGEPDAVLAYGAQLMHLRRQQGRADELLPALRDTQGFADYDLRPILALINADSGALDEARAAAGDLLDTPLPPPGSQLEVQALCLVAELACALEHRAAAVWLYERLRACAGLFLLNQVAREGPIDHQLGLLAATAGDLEAAVGHFASALTAAEAAPLPYWAAESQVGWARVLLRHGRRADTAAARSLLARAGETARRLGFTGTLRKITAAGAGAST
ncbi:AAA family ATPase [Actinokineospora sp. NBRC 105648]|uniref:ATP-binding protein n=1 Tax=Actinokineospora sp. NBRC 105648 TaxID=3032206 RepID=UPI0025537BE8|nr:AAA family ATPase [Actinokineospora sp. NBRC 105648]